MEKQTKEYFDSYPKQDAVYQTADGYLFHTDHEAKNHARELEEKVVVRIARPGANPESLELTETVAKVTLPATGIEAVAPVVTDEAGAVISPGVGDFSTSPVAAEQLVDKANANVVVDPGTAEPDAKTEVVVETEAPAAIEPEVLAPEAQPEKAEKPAGKRRTAKK